MPVIYPEGFTLDFEISKKNAAGEDIVIVNGNGTDYYNVSMSSIKWDGSIFTDIHEIGVYFSDGRAPYNLVKDGVSPTVMTFKAAFAGMLDVTFIAKPSNKILVTKQFQFS
jgi:hypothetical protein